jgi:transposase
MSAEQSYETQRIDHLGIVSGICQEIGLIEQIDGQVKASGRKVSCGQATQALVLNALGFVGRALYLTPDYMQNKPVDLLIGPGLHADDFNDDTLGRCLDDLYVAGVTEVFFKVAAHALQVYGLRSDFVHLDSSSFHLHGAYETEDPERQAVSVTYGYSKDHRPDLKQVVVQLIGSHKSAMPVWLEVLSGNSNDKKTFTATVKAYCQQLQTGEQPYLVMDSAGYSGKTLKAAQDMRWLVRVPETLAQARKLVQETPAEEMQALASGYQGKEFACEYAGIAQRWLVVFSEAAYKRELKTLEKAQAKELETAQKEWRKAKARTFQCQEDADNALGLFNKKWKYHHAIAQAIPIKQYPRRGRPMAQDQKEVVGYNLQGHIEADQAALQHARRSRGRFIIATNDLDTDRLTAQAMLDNYKDQGVSVERGVPLLERSPVLCSQPVLEKTGTADGAVDGDGLVLVDLFPR